MDALLLLLLDSRAPAGGHNHSSGLEPAVMTGAVRGLADVEDFCHTRLRTAGAVAAAFAAAACELAGPVRGDAAREHAGAGDATSPHTHWAELDAELDARLPSEALRVASRSLGSGLLRLVRAMLPSFEAPWVGIARPHHPLVLGAAVAAAGGDPQLAARAAALNSVAGPASAAVRLLGLDPFAVQAMLARLADGIDAAGPPDPFSLPAASAPALDLLADYHLTAEVRLFAS